jgi:hypothetical protein
MGIDFYIRKPGEQLCFVAYETSDGHIHTFSDVPEASIEDMAEGLAFAVDSCSPDKHDGHGRKHSKEDVEAAYRDGVRFMLENPPASLVLAEIDRKIALHKRWGGHAPKIVITPNPDDPKAWMSVTTDNEGSPTLAPLARSFAKELRPVTDQKAQESIKDPKTGFWYTLPKTRRELRRFMRKLSGGR